MLILYLFYYMLIVMNMILHCLLVTLRGGLGCSGIPIKVTKMFAISGVARGCIPTIMIESNLLLCYHIVAIHRNHYNLSSIE